MRSFLPTGQLPIYSQIDGAGIFVNKNPEFVIFGQVRYEKGFIELSFKEESQDFIFNPDAPEYKVLMDIATVSIFKTLLEGVIDNSFLTEDKLVKIANTVGPNNKENQKMAYINTYKQTMIIQIPYLVNNEYQFKVFTIFGSFQLKNLLSLIKTSEKILINTFGEYDLYEKYKKGVGSIPPAGAGINPPRAPENLPQPNTTQNINSENQDHSKMDSAPVSELAPVNQSAPVRPGDEISDIPEIPELPVI